LPRSGDNTASTLRMIPAVSVLLDRAEIAALASRYSREFITDLVREAVEDLRRAAAAGTIDGPGVARFADDLPSRLERMVSRRFEKRTAPVLNATGVIVHTNLGRSPLSAEALARSASVASGYCDLEYDLAAGGRGSRQGQIEALLGALFPGRRGLAVNNNSGAVMLALNTIAEGKEVVISRGELVEIGGSFRIPDVMAKSGVLLREVGTTNRTRLGDFESALSERTGLLLKVHRSNYRIVGFTEDASLADMAALGRARGIPVLVDQGSGNLLDLSAYGLRDEPTAGALLQAGADVVTFSGDKLLGGPQAGIIVGREDLVDAMKRNPFYRALRPDKITVAALEATLESFVAGDPLREIPTLRMLVTSPGEIRRRSEAFASRIEKSAPGRFEVRVEEGVSRVGGGAAPMEDIPTFLIHLRPRTGTVEDLEAALRLGRPPVVARVREGWLIADLRTVPEEREAELGEALLHAAP